MAPVASISSASRLLFDARGRCYGAYRLPYQSCNNRIVKKMIFERLNNIFLRAEVVDTTLLRNNPLRSHKQLEGISRKQSNLHVSNVILKFELGGDAGASNAIGKSYECRSSRHYGCKEEDGAACVTMHGGCFCFVLEEPAVLVLRRVVAQSHLSSPKHKRQRVSAYL
jgi:hypothetical protein